MFLKIVYIRFFCVMLLCTFCFTVQGAAADRVILGTTKTYTVNQTPGSRYSWQIDGGLPLASTTNSVSVTWNTVGIHTLTVKEKDINDCYGQSVALEVRVELPPNLEIAVADVCAGNDLVFTATNIPGATYSWKLNGNPIIVSGYAYTISTPPVGSYTVEVQYTLLGYTSDPANQTAVVNPIPVVNELIASKNNACQGSDLVFTVSPAGYSTYNWTVQGVEHSETSNTLHYKANNPGAINVYVTATHNGCTSDPQKAQAVILAAPTPRTMDYEACATKGQLMLNSLVAAQGRKNWYATEISTNPITAPTINTEEPQSTVYYVSAVTSQGCESERVPVSINIYENPIFISEAVKQEGRTAEIRVEKGTPPYIYKLRDAVSSPFYTTTVVDDLIIGKNPIEISDAQGCKVSAIVEAKINLIPDEYFSPNGDGIHDYWLIKNIESYPNTIIIIRDRYGKELARYKGADFKGWDGKYQGNPVISDDYWYEIQVHEIGDRMIGHFNLRR